MSGNEKQNGEKMSSIPYTPTLTRMLELKDQTQLCGEFLEWLQGKYAMFDKKMVRDDPFYHGGGDYINIEHVIAEFFGIDLEEAEKEKEELLRGIRG